MIGVHALKENWNGVNSDNNIMREGGREGEKTIKPASNWQVWSQSFAYKVPQGQKE